MKAIINGFRYDTESAEKLAILPGTNDRTDFRYEETWVYRTASGRFFLAGHGGARSRWAREVAQNEWSGGEGIQALTPEEAQMHLESCQAQDALERYFDIKEA